MLLRRQECAISHLPQSQTPNFLLLGVLLSEQELTHEPVKVPIVGGKDDAQAAALHLAALADPTEYKRVQWGDKREGKLPYDDVTYPDYPEAAAFACTNTFCSLLVTEVGGVAEALKRLQR